MSTPIPDCERPLVDATHTALREELGHARLDELRAVGSQLSLQAVIRQAALRRPRSSTLTALLA